MAVFNAPDDTLLHNVRQEQISEWLTVEEIAAELKISKSIVYRLIRSGELEAVDIVDNQGRIARKGHYRVRRISLNQYLENKKVKLPPGNAPRTSRVNRVPKAKKDYLGE